MIVICLEGTHGVGKSKLCAQFRSSGFEVLDEAFLKQEEYSLHPQSFVMETHWVSNWFQRLLKKQAELRAEGNEDTVCVADRSPYSAVFYAQKYGEALKPVIDYEILELSEQAGIDVYTVHLKVDHDLLWERIVQRLKREPERFRYKEDKREWMENTLRFYESFKWDFTIDNNQVSIDNLMNQLVAQLESKVPRFKRVVGKSLMNQALKQRLTPSSCMSKNAMFETAFAEDLDEPSVLQPQKTPMEVPQ